MALPSDKQAQVEELLKKVKECQKELTNIQTNRQKLITQLSEVELAKKEMDLTKEGDEIYKLTGTVLLPQNRDEALMMLTKTQEHLKTDLQRLEDLAAQTEKRGEEIRQQIVALQ
ncbi:putative prefoldin beta subunit [Blattamonas nauphoetae]|uniref:Prefoldin beta subunit n=1 Tax=Blattamonas nauphoetae TaxID=2049346 RepID=A0ABQ9XJE7_9EUKA|nr:putative prefoldin beta subunit [Blattamonas nauphoetae]